MARLLVALFLPLVPLAVVLSAGEEPATTTELVSLKHLDARDVALMFGGQPGAPIPAVDPTPARRDFAEQLRTGALEAAKADPEAMREAGLYAFAPRTAVEAFVAPQGYRLPYRYAKPDDATEGRGLAALLPDGLTRGPVAFIDENAVIVQGSTEAIDEFREIVALLDKAPRRVRLSVRLIALTAKGDEGLHRVGLLPPEPVGDGGDDGSAGSVLVDSNRLAILRTGLAVPFVAAPGEGQPDDYQVGAALDAREFAVMPRVNADSSVSMFVVPADGPEREVAWPATTGPASITPPPLPPGHCVVRVGDGETAVFAGFPRVGELLAREGGPIHAAEPGASADPQALLLITAHVLPPEEAQAALPR